MSYLLIEHLEDMSEWLWLEYRHAAEWWGNRLVFTNVPPDDGKRLANIGSVLRPSVVDFPFDRSEVIVLDPQADDELRPDEIGERTVIVVGGILGDAIPRGRTRKFITSKMEGVRVRNIGKVQYSIDGASIVAKMITGGMKVKDIEYEENPTLRLDDFSELTLHYAVPKLDGKLLLTPGLIEFQRRKLGYTGSGGRVR